MRLGYTMKNILAVLVNDLTLITYFANAMRMRLTTDAITQSICVHPALPEVVQRAFGALQL